MDYPLYPIHLATNHMIPLNEKDFKVMKGAILSILNQVDGFNNSETDTRHRTREILKSMAVISELSKDSSLIETTKFLESALSEGSFKPDHIRFLFGRLANRLRPMIHGSDNPTG